MQEKVGKCSVCHKTIYCLDGFLNGVITDDKILYCFSCSKEEQDQ
ncbi:hypothetical protein [Bacillus sp. SA1-12]|nr:hypothetical protein [Bacillus sp. SA1-12]